MCWGLLGGLFMAWVRNGSWRVVTGVGLTNITVNEYFLGRFYLSIYDVIKANLFEIGLLLLDYFLLIYNDFINCREIMNVCEISLSIQCICNEKKMYEKKIQSTRYPTQRLVFFYTPKASVYTTKPKEQSTQKIWLWL